jgi:hypothetical protein
MPSLRGDAIFRNFGLIHTAKREEELDQVLGRIFGYLADDSTHGVGDGGVEEDRAHLHAGKIDAYLLAGT